MKNYKVIVEEKLSRIIDVKANSKKEAVNNVYDLYKKEEIVLNEVDLKEQNFIEINDVIKKEELILEVIDYLWKDEEKHFEESEKPKNHIFLKLKRLKEITNE